MISYEALEAALASKGVGKTQLAHDLSLSTRTVAKIAKGERLSRRTLQRIADYLGLPEDGLMREISDNRILQILREEKDARMPGGLYHELQVRMTYNSNHIEGSRLSEEQTRLIFETSTIDAVEALPVDDILETLHHFQAIDYIIDNAEAELTEDMVKQLHFILKHDTQEQGLPWFAVGDYKRRPNMVGGLETSRPSEVHDHMKTLLEGYGVLEEVTLEDIVAFHAEFERIHPFQDGNGRVGRLIALKECLRHRVTPFIIEDAKKGFYYRGLAQWGHEWGWLMDTCRDAQDRFTQLLDELGISQ